ncbi:MAG TPA: adenylate/guanylate cyclase domain-containing protein [Dongiaceae bacterium]|nr:adenylate/guanylate cyclase domain-containing protein [Dongiaceae bacterium]
MKRGWDLAVGAAILIGALALRGVDPLPLQQLRNLTFDSYQRLKPRAYDPASPVVIATIDEKSLDKFGQWPWSRTTLARITDRLTELGAAAVAFDVLFAEPDRTSPTAIVANLPNDAKYDTARAELATLPDPDTEFAAALVRAPSVIAFAYSDDAALAADPSIAFPYGFSIIGAPDSESYVAGKVQGARYAILPLPALVSATHGMGEVHAGDPDPDGVIRHVPLAVGIGNKLYPTLAGDTLRIGIGGQTAQVKLTRDGYIDRMRIGEAIIPVNDRGELLLYDTGLVDKRYISLADLFSADFDASRITGHLVLVGSTVEGLKDIRSTPLASVMPGVEIHAQILEQILNGQYLTRPYNADEIEKYYLAGFGLVLLFFLYRRSAIGGSIVLVAAIAMTFGASWWQFAAKGNLFDPIYPGLATIAMYSSGTLVNFLRVEREKRNVRTAMARYLSPVLADQVSQHPEQLKLGGELRELTLMFTDIRGFTQISESLDPQALTTLMNSFLTPMTRVIQDREGFIDKYIGDCIMAFWNAPIDVPSHAQKAILAAYDMRAELKRLNAALKENAAKTEGPEVEIRVGTGLNSGICCVGNMGSEQRLEYSVLGDTVNIASRLEALSPAYGLDLVIGEETASGAPEFALLELDRVRVKGKVLPIRIYTGLGDRSVAVTPEFLKLRDVQNRLLAHYRAKEWDQAEAALVECRGLAPEFLHGFYELYARRIAEYRISPPPADWDGVYEAKTKAG